MEGCLSQPQGTFGGQESRVPLGVVVTGPHIYHSLPLRTLNAHALHCLDFTSTFYKSLVELLCLRGDGSETPSRLPWRLTYIEESCV